MKVLFLVATEDAEDPGIGGGLLGFLVIAFLLVALVVLYRSMRKQLRKVDFTVDSEGAADDGDKDDERPQTG